MTQRYAKKESTPASTRGFNFLHFGHIQFISCCNLGIDSKKSLTLPKNGIFAKSLSTPPYNNRNDICLLCELFNNGVFFLLF